MPKRIQRRRKKGWRMPENAIYVGRPTKWGNPYRPGDEHGTRTVEEAVRKYRHYIKWRAIGGHVDFEELRGKDLACWCRKGAPCHADVLLEFYNQ